MSDRTQMKEMRESIADSNLAPTPAIRVLFFDHTGELGGGEIALLNLVRYLNRDTVKPLVVLGADGPLVPQLQETVNTNVLPLPLSVSNQKKDSIGIATLFRIREIFGVLAYVWRLARFIRKHDIDLVHTNSLKADLIGGIAGRLSLCPVVWHVRDRIEDDYLPRSVVRIFRLLCRVVPSYVIANSEATLRTIRPHDVEVESSGVSGKTSISRTIVIHDGTIVPPAQEVSTKNSGLFRIGLIGRISPWKGQHIFLQAAAHVFKRFPNARFVIVGAALFGEDDYDQELKRLPKRLGIEDVVEFAGFRNDIGRVIGELDLVVHASITGEPFGQVIIEGMAAGKPVVATNGGGVPEIVEDGITGILVPMGDARTMAEAICEVLADPARAREMGTRGRQRVENHFTVKLTATKVEAVYCKVLRRRSIASSPRPATTR
jgi:glycosyltransferase involved in cell wall biosynthesis